MERSCGILLPYFSLPGPFATGVFGAEAIEFAHRLHKAGCTYWQVLPFGPPVCYNSPYQCYSSFAGNPMFLDPRALLARGLLTAAEISDCRHHQQGSRIDYGVAIAKNKTMLKTAYARIGEAERQEMAQFYEQERYWLEDYSLFMAIKAVYPDMPFWAWPDKALQKKDATACADFASKHPELINYYIFEQYEFGRQWTAHKKAINTAGIKLIGDLPIYPSEDSADFWGQRHLFECNAEGRTSRVAGVPPDGFSSLGQLWGNPLYRWDRLQRNQYLYWQQRLGKALEWYDKVRLDHFRGFESYWSVPAGEKNAVEGFWVIGPGMDLFNVLLAKFPAEAIIAEDLGYFTPAVQEFHRATGLPGMKILQFAFGSDTDCKERPHNYERNCVAFTGTHDNETFLGWAKSAPAHELARACAYLDVDPARALQEGGQNPLCRKALRALWQSVANLVIVPLQDVLGLDSSYRINLPGTVGGNWETRFSPAQLAALDTDYLLYLSLLCDRTNAAPEAN